MSKAINEIYASMKDKYNENAELPLDDNAGDAKILEAIATELYALYCYGDFVKRQAFVQSATGEHLERLGELRGVTRKCADKAQGTLTFYLSEAAETAVNIPEGVICSVSGKPYLQYVTTEQCTIPVGESSVNVSAQAISEGKRYNAYPNEIDVMVNAPIGVTGVRNDQPFTGGYDTENDESLRMRIIERYAFETNGVNARMLESVITNLERVTDCFIPGISEPGKLRIYITTKSGLVTPVEKNEIFNKLAIISLFGVTPEVRNAARQDFSISIRLKVRPSCDKTLVEQELRNAVDRLYAKCRIGSAFSLEDVEKQALLIDGVLDASAASEQAISKTVYCEYGKKLNIRDLAVSFYEA